MLIHVPLHQIDDNPFQARHEYEYEDIDTLAADIRQRGLLQIPLGRLLFDSLPVGKSALERTLAAANGWPGGQSFRVQLAFGHRRLRAWRTLAENNARYATMPVYIEALEDEQMLDAVWSENQHRTDITAVEQAELLVAKLERVRSSGGNQQTVADEWGLDRSTIANKLRLLDLPSAVQDAVRTRRLSERQALALVSILRIGQEMRPQKGTLWSDRPNVYEPMKPDKFLSWLLDREAEVSSDDIRKYREKLLRHVGRSVPDIVATTAVPVVEPVRQAQYKCKGCPARFDQVCVDSGCLSAKKRAVGEHIARAAATEVGLPYSDDPAHFSSVNSWDAAQELRELYDRGITDNLVIGYNLDGQGSRLYKDSYGGLNYADGRSVVLIGHRHGTATQAEMAAAANARPDTGSNGNRSDTVGPAAALRAAWAKAAKAAHRARHKRGRAAFEPLLDEASPVLRRALWGLLAAPAKRDKPFDTPALVAALFERTYSSEPGNRDEWRELLAACGLDPDAADDPDPVARLRDACAVALDRYYHFDSEFSRRRGAADVAVACELLDAWTDQLPDSMEMMAYWLNQARARPVAAGVSEPLPTEQEPETLPTF